MANPFENYTFEKANQAFAALKTSLAEVETNRLFVRGNDWQNGAGWVGPQFDGQRKMDRDLKKAIEREFTSKSSIKAVVRRHRRGVIGRVPNWQVSSRTAPAGESAEEIDKATEELIGEAQIILNEFWKQSRVHQTLKDFVTDYLTAERAILRLFFVQSDEGELEPAATIPDAVRLVHLFKEEPEAGMVVVDKETLKKASLFRYERDGRVFIEICYVDDDGDTIWKKLSQDDAADFARSTLPTIGRYIDAQEEESDFIPLPLNGKLLVFEMRRDAFVTAAMRSQQKLVNKAYTMLSHNLDVSGFRERVYLNAMPPGEVVVDAAAPGGKKFVPDPTGVEAGASVVNYAQGLKVVERDAEGKIKNTFTTPGVFESDPIPVTTYVETAVAGSEAILEEADQKHIAISGDATASGESRIQAQSEFKQSLEDTKSDFDDCVSDVFEAVLAVVAYLMDNPGRYDELQVTVSAILNPGPVSPELMRVLTEQRDKGIRSTESAMEESGIIDPDSMKAKIQTEPEYLLALIKTIGDSMVNARGVVPVRMQAEIIAQMINLEGWTPERIMAELAKTDPVIGDSLEEE